MPLKHIVLNFELQRDIELLRSIKTLEKINGKPAAEFLNEVDEQQKGKKPLAFQTPAFQTWMNDVAALPPEQQVEAVTKKLMELNPGFDGKITPKIENGVVMHLTIFADEITDISPVRALRTLITLGCYGTDFGKGKLADLSPLKGMQLRMLEFSRTQVSDLSPLKGMPLTFLMCPNTKVSDLSPLQGMPLNRLWITATQVSDLSPLQDMPLRDISLDFKPDRDTELLRSIKALKTINDKPAAEVLKEVEAASN